MSTKIGQVKDTAKADVAISKGSGGGEVESANMKQCNINTVTEEIKKLSVDTFTLKETVETSTATLDNTLETMNQNIGATNNEVIALVRESNDKMNQHLVKIETYLEAHMKQQRLQYLISVSQNKDFQYQWKKINSYISFLFCGWPGGSGNATNSEELAFEVLQRFHLGLGYDIPPEYYSTLSHKTLPEITEEGKALFRRKLMKYLEHLIGHEPRLVHNFNGTFTAYYS